MTEIPKSILFVRLGAIGDVVNALCVASAVRRAAPATRIGWAVHDQALPLVSGHPSVDHVHRWPRTGGAPARRKRIAEVRAIGYEAACDLQRIAKSALFVKRSGARRRIGFPRAETKEWSWLWTNEKVVRGPGLHRVDAYLDVARQLGVRDPQPAWELPSHPAAERWADELLEELGGPPLVLNIGATKSANRWSPNRFGELARFAHKDFPDVPLCLLGGPSDAPGGLRAMSMTKERHGLRNLIGKTTLPQAWELLRRARLVVTGDTGPMHLAHAVGAPLVVLAGGSDLRVTGPYGPAQVVRVPPECAPCARRECNRPRHDCLEDISAELAYQTVASALHAGPATRAVADLSAQ